MDNEGIVDDLLSDYDKAVQDLPLVDAIDCTQDLIEHLQVKLECLRSDQKQCEKEFADPNDESLKLPDEDIACYDRDYDGTIRKVVRKLVK